MESELTRAGGYKSDRRRAIVAPRHIPLGALTAAVALAAWLLVDPRTPDLAAQVYRTGLFQHNGFQIFDEHWYAGHQLPGYSLIFPALASIIGIRLLAVICVIASSLLFERLSLRVYATPARWASVWFAITATGDVWIGRLTFALGVTLALAAVVALLHGRRWTAGCLALACAAGSPVAGLFLALAAITYTFTRRRPGVEMVLIAPAVILTLGLALAFPEGGYEPYPVLSFAASAAVSAGFLWVLPGKARLERIGAGLYLVACVLSLVIRTPMGSNIERYGVLLTGPLLICLLGAEIFRPRAMLVLCGVAVWVIWGPVRETAAVAHNPSTNASYYMPVRRFIAGHGGDLVRVEVPLTRGHWEAALLAPYVSLARGWEKQLDERYNKVLLSKGLTALSYEHWLHQQAVSYVALPDVSLDPSSAREGMLIGRGLPYLRQVFASRHWRIYEVSDPTPISSGPGSLTALSEDSFTVKANAAGRFLLRIHYTRYWTIISGGGCLAPGRGGWTALSAHRPGRITVSARFSLSAALSLKSQSCG